MPESFSNIPDWLTIYSRTTEVAHPPGLDGSEALKRFETCVSADAQATWAGGIPVNSERIPGAEQLIVTPMRADLSLARFSIGTECSVGKTVISERLYLVRPPQRVDLGSLPPRPPMPPGGGLWIVGGVFAIVALFFISCCGLLEVATLKKGAEQIGGMVLLCGFGSSLFLLCVFLLAQGFKKRQKMVDSQEYKQWQDAVRQANPNNQELAKRQKRSEEEKERWKAQILPTVQHLSVEKAFEQFTSDMHAAADEAVQALLVRGAELIKSEEKTRRWEEIEAAIEWELAKEANTVPGGC